MHKANCVRWIQTSDFWVKVKSLMQTFAAVSRSDDVCTSILCSVSMCYIGDVLLTKCGIFMRTWLYCCKEAQEETVLQQRARPSLNVGKTKTSAVLQCVQC